MYLTKFLITTGEDMAEIVTISSNARVGVLSCIKTKFAFLEKQLKIWEKLYEIVDQGGLNGRALPGERISYSIAFTLEEILEEAQKLELGSPTDVESFELLEKLIAVRDHDEAKAYLDNHWTELIDKTIEAVLYSMEH